MTGIYFLCILKKKTTSENRKGKVKDNFLGIEFQKFMCAAMLSVLPLSYIS